MWNPPPPFYILFAHSPLSSSSSGAASHTLGHPTIQYHYQDDSPLALLPQHVDEHVLVLDYSTTSPTVHSLSKTLVATGLRTEEAPGAAAADKVDLKNDRMYIIETTEIEDHAMATPQSDRNSAHTILAQFKQRNALLRRALLYPNNAESCELDRSTSHLTIPSSQ